MARRRYIVGYDIADPKRLRKTHDVVQGYGYRLQFSVFICDLSDAEKIALKSELSAVIHFTNDQVSIVDLGDVESRGQDCFEFMGIRPSLPAARGPMIF